ncbi:hypothetical protein ACFW08_20080 [Streptomyces sp. NPDC058960]|uniref:hypothetical protein n=1 Tax=Streptomyces sp. NPDC058960 TaxID=3346679 RepID=UPI0036B24B3C
MNEWNIALGALVLLLSLAAGAPLSRWYFAPTGSHRTAPVDNVVPLEAFMRPQAAETNDVGWCPAEQAERLHAYHPDKSRTCWTCRTVTPAGVPRV